MAKLIVSSLATLIAIAGMAATPAFSQPEAKTTLIALDGTSVDRMQLHHDFDAAWVLDKQSILYRDTTGDHYLVTLKAACDQIEIRGRSFDFHPSWTLRLLSSNSYEIRPDAGERCGVSKVEQIDKARARPLRDAAQRRVW